MRILSRPAFVLGAACAMLVAPPALAQDEEPTEGELELAELLEGRVAGEPQECIRTFPSRNFRAIDGTALVYETGRTIWVNYTRTPDAIDEDDFLVVRKFGSSGTQTCRSDQVTTRDRFAGFFSGIIRLDEFVPYRLPEDADGS